MSQTTPLSQLLKDDGRPQQDPTAQYANLPKLGGPQVDTRPVTNMVPTGVSQGLSMPGKEFFGLKEFDWKSAILVFVLIFILCSGMYTSLARSYVPGAVNSDGKLSIIGSLIAAILGTLVYVIVKFFGKF